MGSPLHRVITERLRARIRDGEFPVGSALPSEAQLCREFSASRGPVRQALGVLRAEGLVEGGQGRRATVRATARESVPAQPFETFLSFTDRAELTGRRPGQRLHEIARRRPDPAAARALGLAADELAVTLVRLRLLDDEPAMLERTTFVASVGRLLLAADLDGGSIYALLAEHGVDLRAASHTFDAVAADALDAELLGIEAGAPLLRERRLTTGPQNTPFEWSDDRYRPDVATVTLTTTRGDYDADLS